MKKVLSTILILLLLMGNMVVYATDLEQVEPVQEKPQAKVPIYSYDNPIVPRGFTHTEGTWNTGFVIQDEDGNEFVWVPVDGTNVTYAMDVDVAGAYGTETVSEEELKSIEKFGGFYIGRYETGLEGIYDLLYPYLVATDEEMRENIKQTIIQKTNITTNTPLIKANEWAWSFVSATTAKTVAENMYEEDEIGGFTKLMNNHDFDTISAWFYDSGAMSYDDLYTDSTNFGNYLSSEFQYWNEDGEHTKESGSEVLIRAGSFMINNISDLCGNMFEITAYETEGLGIEGNVNLFRGGAFRYNGSDYPIWMPAELPLETTSVEAGFRIVLHPTEEPPIPEGFTYVEGTEETGFTIQDADQNQFVWVPVDGTTVSLAQRDWGIGDLTIANVKDPEYTELTTSITNYGGFYIAKYEASVEGISLADKVPETNISYTDAYNKCNEYAPSTEIQSHLVYGAEWDAILQWLNTSSTSYPINTTKGNYSGEIANTGATTTDIVLGICDMAGNVREWTQETSNTNYKVFRGGYYNHEFASGYRNSDIPETQDKYIGYRAAFYIK